MPAHSASRTLPWTCEQLFDLAADVESYPRYLPGWISAELIEHSDTRLRVRQRLGLGPLNQPFVSTAELQRPQRVTVTAADGPFRRLNIEWRFEPAAHDRCRVSLDMDYRLRNPLLEGVAATFFSRSASDVVERFAERARLIYGAPTTP